MPRININEKDRTSPGTPGGYSNNTVLIAGFSAYTDDQIKANAKAVQADDNGIFEFESADDFVKTIGLVAPTIHMTGEGADNTYNNELPVHYGNQMAYELLKLGYPVIYINLGVTYENEYTTGTTTLESVQMVAATKMKKLGNFDETWAIFKDKASYDFRFVSHGLLTSSEFAKTDDLVRFEARVEKMDELMHAYDQDLNDFTALLALKEANNISAVDQAKLTAFYQQVPVTTEGAPEGSTRPESDTEVETRLKKVAIEKVLADEKIFVFGSTNSKNTAEASAIGYTSKLLAAAVDNVAESGKYDAAKEAVETQKTNLANELKKAGADVFTSTDFAAANAAIAKLAHYKAEVASDGSEDEMAVSSGRGDCVALVEVDESEYITKVANKRPESQIIDAINAMADINADNGKYCACTVPSVVYKMTADERFDGNTKFPGAFHYLACLKNSLGLGFAEWYAVAGYTRGVASYVIDYTTVKLGEIAIQALEPRNIKDQAAQPKFAVNVIANFRGSYYLWGNRTCHPLGDAKGGNDLVASHFLNIRQLCSTIKKQLYVSCRRFTFDPNSDVLWINFKNSITPMLERMKADQGVRDFKIEKVYTDKKATLKARIRIVPIEAVEDFLLEVSLEDSLGETSVTVTE